MSRGWGSNPRPAVYKTAALTTELPRQHVYCTKKRGLFRSFCRLAVDFGRCIER